MNGEDIVIVATAGIFVGGVIALYSINVGPRNAERMKRLKLIEKALAQPSIDEQTKQQMLALLAADEERSQQQRSADSARWRSIGRSLISGLGWIMFVGGGALLLGRESGLFTWIMPEPGFLLLAVGFICMTLPVAVRELGARRHAAPAEQ